MIHPYFVCREHSIIFCSFVILLCSISFRKMASQEQEKKKKDEKERQNEIQSVGDFATPSTLYVILGKKFDLQMNASLEFVFSAAWSSSKVIELINIHRKWLDEEQMHRRLHECVPM